jgi:hypothetical protein
MAFKFHAGNVPKKRRVFNDAESFSCPSSFFGIRTRVFFALQIADNNSQAANSGDVAGWIDFDCFSGKIILSWL